MTAPGRRARRCLMESEPESEPERELAQEPEPAVAFRGSRIPRGSLPARTPGRPRPRWRDLDRAHHPRTEWSVRLPTLVVVSLLRLRHDQPQASLLARERLPFLGVGDDRQQAAGIGGAGLIDGQLRRVAVTGVDDYLRRARAHPDLLVEQHRERDAGVIGLVVSVRGSCLRNV